MQKSNLAACEQRVFMTNVEPSEQPKTPLQVTPHENRILFLDKAAENTFEAVG